MATEKAIGMKTSTRQVQTFSSTKRANPAQKLRRRHTRILLDSLRPRPSSHPIGSASQCPKCEGRLYCEPGEHLDSPAVRCLNCGWQPQYQMPDIQESEEAKTIRSLTAEFFSDWEWHRIPPKF